MGVVDDVAPGRLAEDGVETDQRRIGQAAFDGCDYVAQHVAGADARQLIHVADQHQVRARPDGADQVLGQEQIEHGGLVHDDQVGVEGVGLVPGETQQAVLRLDLQHAVHRLGQLPGGLAQALGRTAKRLSELDDADCRTRRNAILKSSHDRTQTDMTAIMATKAS